MARQRAIARTGVVNGRLDQSDLEQVAPLDDAGRAILEQALTQGRLSARGVGRVRSVARTLADLEEEATDVTVDHLCLAMSLRIDPFGVLR